MSLWFGHCSVLVVFLRFWRCAPLRSAEAARRRANDQLQANKLPAGNGNSKFECHWACVPICQTFTIRTHFSEPAFKCTCTHLQHLNPNPKPNPGPNPNPNPAHVPIDAFQRTTIGVYRLEKGMGMGMGMGEVSVVLALSAKL